MEADEDAVDKGCREINALGVQLSYLKKEALRQEQESLNDMEQLLKERCAK